MLINNFAKYSGKGTPMISRRGKSTICLYACFKHGLTDIEMAATGLKPSMDPELIEKIKTKDKYAHTQAKVFSQNSSGNNSKLQEIRERIRGSQQYGGNANSVLQSGYGVNTEQLFKSVMKKQKVTHETAQPSATATIQPAATAAATTAENLEKSTHGSQPQHQASSHLDDMDNSQMNGYEFLKDLCHNLVHEKKNDQRPLSSAFRGISRDKSLIYNVKKVGPHCGRYKPNYSLVEQRIRVANFNLNVAENPYQNIFNSGAVKSEELAKPICDKFKLKQDKLNQSLLDKEQLNKKASEMQQIIDKILKKNSPTASMSDKKKLIQSLEKIPLEKRREVIIQLAKQLQQNEISKHDSEISSKRNSIIANETFIQNFQSQNGSPLKQQSRMNVILQNYNTNQNDRSSGSIIQNQTLNSFHKRPTTQQSYSQILENQSINNKSKRPGTSFDNQQIALKRIRSTKYSAGSIGQAKTRASANNYSMNMTRESFFDHLQGANENRFVPFNNMPSNCTKYKFNDVHNFDKYISRDQGAKSDRAGNSGINPSKNAYLQDYDFNFNFNKPKLDKGGVISFEKQIERPPIYIKKCYEGAANQFQLLYNTEKNQNQIGHNKQPEVNAAWDKQLPRDNAIYNLSETLNLRDQDYEKREEFKKQMKSKKARSQSHIGGNSNYKNQYSSLK
ncbi:UNKNOWN [Stylonychia lemnae]|uniref:Uncharacterized protein n=1 Tax=Stylonychia lemnae TaxID=5949 RepID=A0A078AHW3_STYLE|nr:UNKNOWN [Stylonychia lemnae]|eukprot:CDW81839.1 UNKNOWN [Stylonychia lemnae]